MMAQAAVGLWDNAELVYAYSRAQAIEDGVLVDISDMAAEAGFRYPVAVTEAVWNMIEAIPDTPKGRCQDTNGRLWDVLTIAKVYSMLPSVKEKDRFHFPVLMDVAGTRKRKHYLKSIVGPGDTPDPVITISLPDED